jgi:hypothetical protein
MSKIDPLSPINASYTGITKLNAHLDKIEAALQNTVSRDGSAPNFMEADIDMNSRQLVNLGTPTLDHHATTKQYVDALAFGEITISLPDTVGRATSRADLEAMTIPSGEAAVIVEYNAAHGDQWGGTFVWRSGNRTSPVSIDVSKAVWVPPASDVTGASGAWQRLRDGNYVNAAWFGIRGDAGVTTNTPTMFQQMEDFCNSQSSRTVFYRERNYYWSDTIVMRHSNIAHIGAGVVQTLFTFNHTNNGIQYGDDANYCYRPTLSNIGYIQTAGTAYAHNMFCAREVSIREYIKSTNVRNFIKVGSTRVNITNVTNNGSGLVRITLGSAQTWQTGMYLWVNRIVGDASLTAAVAALAFRVNRVSATEFDLQGTTFAGTYTSGGVCAPVTTQLELANVNENGDNMKVQDKYYADVYGLAGNLLFLGTHIAECPNKTVGSVGINFRKNTTPFDRLDFVQADNLFLRRFEKGIFKDNCRVVSIRANDVGLDECANAILFVDDDAAAETKGAEEVSFNKLRVGYDPNFASGKTIRILASTSDSVEWAVGQLTATGTDNLLELVGGPTAGGSGIFQFWVGDTKLEPRFPVATTKDAISIDGRVDFVFDNISARSQSAGTSRDVVSIASGWSGNGHIGHIQMQGFTGVGVNVNSSVVDATANLSVGRVQNSTTRYNIITDNGNIIRNYVWHAGDMGVVADGTTDNTTALNAIFGILSARGGGVLKLQRGTTLVTGQLSLLGGGITVEGDSAGRSYLRSTYATTPQFIVGPLSGTRADEIYFRNVTFWGMQGIVYFHQRWVRGLYFDGCKATQLGGLITIGDSGATSGAYITEIRDCEFGCAFPEIVVAADTGFTVGEVLTFGSGGTATLSAKSGTTFTLKFLTATPSVSTSVTGGTSLAVTTVASRRPGVDFIDVLYGIGELNIYNSRIEGGYDWTVSGVNFSNNAWESNPGVAGLFDTFGIHDTYLARFRHNIEVIDRRLGNVNWSNVRLHEAGVSAVQWEIPTGSTRALDRTGGGSGTINNLDVSSGYTIAGVYAKGFVLRNDSTVNSYIGDLSITGLYAGQSNSAVLELDSQRTLGLRNITVNGVTAAQMASAGADGVVINAGSTTAFTGVMVNNVNVVGTFSDAIASTGGSVPDGGLRIGHDVHASGTFTNRINGTLARTGQNAGSVVYDPASLADGAGVTTTVTVTGAVLGDQVNVSFSLDLQGITMTGWVSSANTVSVRFQNETGGAIDLGSGTIRAIARMAG